MAGLSGPSACPVLKDGLAGAGRRGLSTALDCGHFRDKVSCLSVTNHCFKVCADEEMLTLTFEHKFRPPQPGVYLTQGSEEPAGMQEDQEGL